jgi:aerobic C4-dicarboxylate transport protein
MTSTTQPPPTQRSRLGRLSRELWFQVIVGAVLGIAVGLFFPQVGTTFAPLNNWFIGLVKMIVVPVVFCVVVTGIASMDNLRKAGRIGAKALGYFLTLSLTAMVIGLVVGNIFKPGEGLNVDPSTLDTGTLPDVEATHITLTGFIDNLIPDSLFGALTGGEILSALLVSIAFGVALNIAGPQAAPLVRGVAGLSKVVFRIVGWVMRLAPLGTFGALATVVAQYGASSLQQLGMLILVFFATCIFFIVVVLGVVMRLSGLRLFPLIRYLKAELLVALSTCSSEAVLPQLVRRLEHLGAGRPRRLGHLPDAGLTVPGPGGRHRPQLAAAARPGGRHDAHQQGNGRHRRGRLHRPGQHSVRTRHDPPGGTRPHRRRRPHPQRGPCLHQRPRQRRGHHRGRQVGEGLRHGPRPRGTAA